MKQLTVQCCHHSYKNYSMETFKDPVNNINTTNYLEGKKMNTFTSTDVTLLSVLLFLFSYKQLLYDNRTTPDSTTN